MATKKKDETKEKENEFLKKMTGINDDVPQVNTETKPKLKAVNNDNTNDNTNEVTNVKSSVDTSGIADIVDKFYEEQQAKELQGEIKGNYTLVVRHDLMERLNVLDEHYPRGFKSDLVNEALEAFITLYEQKPLPPKRKRKGRR